MQKTSSIVFLGEISCGFPSPATDYLEPGLNLHELVVKKPSATFFMRAKGDSMIGAGIFPRDILVIDRSIFAVSGHVVVASLNGEFTLKKLSYQNGAPVLLPANPKYKPIFISKEDDFQIFGVLTYHLHQHI
ncbi:MAG: translesion error-prone DNA polymerase V autoproteolytic subunit [Bdellovibrionaceae bacterium]|nr:translesion error-prone DNA polymerase V autoproteolytic subunit [Pseudobdellovibrionaceae bacterium]NUM59392.1 translesion error-prone DNA polymerase V autoproteolytic subunit [Pseudobdellovibrionaceae bacterium]